MHVAHSFSCGNGADGSRGQGIEMNSRGHDGILANGAVVFLVVVARNDVLLRRQFDENVAAAVDSPQIDQGMRREVVFRSRSRVAADDGANAHVSVMGFDARQSRGRRRRRRRRGGIDRHTGLVLRTGFRTRRRRRHVQRSDVDDGSFVVVVQPSRSSSSSIFVSSSPRQSHRQRDVRPVDHFDTNSFRGDDFDDAGFDGVGGVNDSPRRV
mmetsp:Transcript_22251/g.44733  ORF Transcript_22251/g.44733 Transcript_22251/m.44733 type:complete len:211 (-) Transcript_22251:332-964(-)